MIYLYILYSIYVLAVVLPTVLVFVFKKINKKLFNLIVIIDLILITLIPFVINSNKLSNVIDIKDSDKVASIIYSAAVSLACIYLSHIIRIQREYKEIEEKISRQMERFVNHPVLESKENLDGVITSMFNLPHSRETVLDFFIKSLKEIQRKGAVRINMSFVEYTNLLGLLMEGADTVMGTFTRRPYVIKGKMEKDKLIKEYIGILNKHKNKIDRICVFEKDEIERMRQRNNGREEIVWFKNTIPSNRVKWTETGVFKEEMLLLGCDLSFIMRSAGNRMVDFAIFDDILLRWNTVNDKTDYGTIIMLIGEEAINLRKTMESYMNNRLYGFVSFDELLKVIKK